MCSDGGLAGKKRLAADALWRGNAMIKLSELGRLTGARVVNANTREHGW